MPFQHIVKLTTQRVILLLNTNNLYFAKIAIFHISKIEQQCVISNSIKKALDRT